MNQTYFDSIMSSTGNEIGTILAFPVYDIGAVDLRVIRILGDRNKINNIMEMVILSKEMNGAW